MRRASRLAMFLDAAQLSDAADAVWCDSVGNVLEGLEGPEERPGK